ncbi:MAG: alkaline phosphatase PafA [Balneolaceae bacterium]
MIKLKMALLIFALALMTSLPACDVQQQTAEENPHYETPRLVVGIMVDQLRYDYLYRYWDKYGDDGFKRLLNDGFSFDNAQFDYMPTYTGPGHASVYTGTTPAVHGIIGNNWYVKAEDRSTYVTEDPNYQSVGIETEAGQMSPRWMLSSTISDELRLHTNMRSKVVGISLKDRGSILPAGHTGDAYWFDYDTGDFITSSYYYDELPGWVQQFNSRNLVGQYLSEPWETLLPIEEYIESIEDDNLYEGTHSGQDRPVFPHDLPTLREENRPGMVSLTPFGNELLLELTYAAIEGESLGQNEVTDLLAVSFSSPDHMGHMYGPASVEIQDMYLRFDLQIANLLNYLDVNFGKDNVLVFMTSDHGAGHVPNYLKDLGLPAGNFSGSDLADPVREFLTAEYGEDLLKNVSNQQVFLNRERIAQLGENLQEVQEKVAQFVLQLDGVAGAVTAHALQFSQFTDGLHWKVQRGYNQQRSGDVMTWLEPQWMPGGSTGTTHGSPFSYDIRAPLVWYGWDIPAGRSTQPVYISDIASTLAVYLNTPFPNGNTGNPMNHFMKE